MNIIKPDSGYDAIPTDTTVFLAGSIEMGAAEDWQSVVPSHFKTKQTWYSIILVEMIGIVLGNKKNPTHNSIIK